jgi:hypothetical protein
LRSACVTQIPVATVSDVILISSIAIAIAIASRDDPKGKLDARLDCRQEPGNLPITAQLRKSPQRSSRHAKGWPSL